LLALGIPASPPLAILLAGLMIYGLAPGPVLFEQNAAFVWTVIASMFVGNAMLLILNLPLVGLWAKVTKIPFGIIAPIILVLSILGTYTVRNSQFDVLVMLIFGALGYIFHKYRWPTVPLILSFILGPIVEDSFVQSMAMSAGSGTIFFTRPISLVIMIMAALLLYISLRLIKRTKSRAKEIIGDEANIAD
jgi:putative tricarboxylic transport membrane protein